MGWEGGSRSLTRIAAFVPVLAAVLFLWELVFLHGVPVARDMQMFFVPQKRLLAEALGAGRLPLWTPLIGAGAPFLANFQSGVFYPPHWLFAALPFFAAFNFLVVFHFALGGAFAYLFGREAELSPPGALALALAFMLGGYFASLLNLINALQAAAWVPAFGYALLRHFRRPSAGSVGGMVATGTLGFLAGEPQTFLLGVTVCVAYAGVRRFAERGGAPLGPALAGMVVAAAAVVGLGMVQILPTLELVSESSRGAGLDFEEASAFALQPSRLVHLLLPADYSDPTYRFGIKSQIGTGDPWLFSNYLGVVAIALAAVGWSDRRRRAEALFWSVLAGAGIVVALGDHTPAFRLLYDHVPGVSSFRFPEKFFLLSGLGIAFLAGYGVDFLVGRKPPRGAWIAAAVLAGAAVLAKLAWVGLADPFLETAAARFPGHNFAHDPEFAWRAWGRRVDVFLILSLLLLALLWIRGRARDRRGALAWAFALLLGLDFWIAHRALNPVVDAALYERPPLVAEHIPLEEARRRFRYRAAPLEDPRAGVVVRADVPLEAQKWMWQQMLQPNVAQWYGVLSPDNWDAIHVTRYTDRRSISMLLEEERRRRLFLLHSVKWGYSLSEPPADGPYRRRIPLDSIPGFLYEVERPLPRAYVVPEALPFADEVEALNAVLDAGFDPERQVALLAPSGEVAAKAALERGSTGSARILRDAGETVRIGLGVRAPGWLVLTDTWYPGWRAFVDGEERPIHRANYFFRAIRVGPGDRTAVFRYRSRALATGARISAATLLVTLLGLAAWRIRRTVPAGDLADSGT